MSKKVTTVCTNEHCHEGVVGEMFGEKITCGVCDGDGVLEIEITK
jgi:hypothetical protein